MRHRGMVVALCLLTAQGAFAADATHSGKFGLGGSQSIGGVTGVDIMFWPGVYAINVIAGLDLTFPSGGDAGINFRLAGGLLFPILQASRADLSIGGRLALGVNSATYSTSPAGETGFQVDLELPVRAEWFVTDHFSLHAEIGLAIEIVTNTTRSIAAPGGNTQSDGFGVVLPGTRLVGGGGFTIYF